MTESDEPNVGTAAAHHPLHQVTRAEVRTEDGLLFRLTRDPGAVPFFLLWPLAASLPQASIPYAEDLGDGRGSGWTVTGNAAKGVEISAGDLLTAATAWTTALFSSLLSPRAAPSHESVLAFLSTVHVYGDHIHPERAPLLFWLDNLVADGGTPYWALYVHGSTEPAASVVYLPDDTGPAWSVSGTDAQGPDRGQLRARDLLTAATAWTIAHHGAAPTTAATP